MSGKFSYTRCEQGIRVDKVESAQAVVIIPEKIENYPVTELGAYVLAGTEVEELHLPLELRKIGAYGFYNCEKLRRIYCGSRITDLGAGLFAGAGGVEFLDITLFEKEKSCLKELLSELRQTLRVRIHLPKTEEDRGEKSKTEKKGTEKGRTEARLIFPEYFEESVENTPARILYIETHGCGHRYRYCFSGTQFQYQGYDELFSHIKVQESERLVTELALGRLQYPLGLTEKYEKIYREYVAEHWETGAKLLIEADSQVGSTGSNLDPGGLPWLVEEILEKQETLEKEEAGKRSEALEKKENQGGSLGWESEDTEVGKEMPAKEARIQKLTQMAQQAGDTEMVVWLMDFRHEKIRKKPVRKQRRFEL